MSNKDKNKDKNTKKSKINTNILKDFIGTNNNEEKLFHFFNKKRIYIEIFNVDVNCSNDYYEILSKYNIIAYKKLNKNIEYIVFKNGHLKTKKYAFINNIILVNEFWIYDKINNIIFKDDKEYIIKTNSTEIILSEKINNDNKNKKSTNKMNDIKNYEIEIEDQFDTEYSQYINEIKNNKINDDNLDIKKENQIKNNNINKFCKIEREKRIYKEFNLNEKKELNINVINGNKKLNNDIKSLCEKRKGKKKSYSKPNVLSNQTIIELKDNSIKLKYINKSFIENNNKNQIMETNIVNNTKINIISYQLKDEEIKALETLKCFKYKGNLEDLNNNNLKIYCEIEYIIIDYNKMKSNLDLYKFFLEKKIVLDFTCFLLEFINLLKNLIII